MNWVRRHLCTCTVYVDICMDVRCMKTCSPHMINILPVQGLVVWRSWGTTRLELHQFSTHCFSCSHPQNCLAPKPLFYLHLERTVGHGNDFYRNATVPTVAQLCGIFPMQENKQIITSILDIDNRSFIMHQSYKNHLHQLEMFSSKTYLNIWQWVQIFKIIQAVRFQ